MSYRVKSLPHAADVRRSTFIFFILFVIRLPGFYFIIRIAFPIKDLFVRWTGS